MLSFFLIAGMSYLFFLITLTDVSSSVGAYLPWLFLIFSFPHFMATYWVWFSRVKVWKDEWLPVTFPVVYLALFFAATKGYLGQDGVEVILKASYLYLLYHFAQQLYGVTLWMNYRQKVIYLEIQKQFLRAFYLLAALYAWIEMETRGVVNVLFYHSVSNWNLPSDYVTACFILVLISTLVNLVWCLFGYLKSKNSKTLLALAPMGVAWLWFLPPFNQKMILLLPVFHGIQYLPFIKLKGKSLSGTYWLVLSGIFVALGWFFFRWLPFHMPYKALEGTLWPAFVLTLLNNHHFFIDGRIWKLKDPVNQDLL